MGFLLWSLPILSKLEIIGGLESRITQSQSTNGFDRRKRYRLRRTECAFSAGGERRCRPQGQSLCGRRDCGLHRPHTERTDVKSRAPLSGRPRRQSSDCRGGRTQRGVRFSRGSTIGSMQPVDSDTASRRHGNLPFEGQLRLIILRSTSDLPSMAKSSTVHDQKGCHP